MIRRIVALYGRFVDQVDRVVSVTTALLLGIVVVLTATEIIGRNVFKYSSPEAVDVTLSFAVLVYLLGYFVLLNRDQDVMMDFLYRRVSRRRQRLLDALTAIGVLAFFAILSVKSLQLFRLGLNSLHPVFPVPHGVVVLPVLIAAFGCVMVALRKALESLLALVDGDGPRDGTRP